VFVTHNESTFNVNDGKRKIWKLDGTNPFVEIRIVCIKHRPAIHGSPLQYDPPAMWVFWRLIWRTESLDRGLFRVCRFSFVSSRKCIPVAAQTCSCLQGWMDVRNPLLLPNGKRLSQRGATCAGGMIIVSECPSKSLDSIRTINLDDYYYYYLRYLTYIPCFASSSHILRHIVQVVKRAYGSLQ
jgi:hypothetical protein